MASRISESGIWRHNPKRVLGVIVMLIILFSGSVLREAYAQSARRQKAATEKKKDEFHRPEPTRPFTPQIPGSNRYRPDKVFLENADSIMRPLTPNVDEEYQIVIGNVKFRQMGMWMFCDSAYYYPQANSLDAFGHVRMEQGDTLFVYADKLYYDGSTRFARLRCGATERTVRLIDRNASLTTDSLDYDLVQDLGWYAFGGRLEDEMNLLTSIYGEYSPTTKNAVFYHDVKLHGKKNDFNLFTDTLYYNTATHIADIVSPTRIETATDNILTSRGSYNTSSGVAELMERSSIIHTDSLGRSTVLDGDSIVYDPATRISKAYSFRDPAKRPSPMVITDTARKATLIGGFGLYNDSTREALAAEYPLMMEYSRGDTLFLRADTIRTWMLDRPRIPLSDSIVNITDSLSRNYAVRNDSLQKNEARTNGSDSTWHKAMAYPRARFFRPDIQGVADTITFTEIDSILRMTRLPVIWNGERQVRGDTIIVHLNDSTADWARIPSHARLMEHVEEDYYNQLHSDKMDMWFEGGTLRRLEGEGSVQAIMLPMENDSTFNRLVDAESSFLTIDMKDGDLDRLKMWPEVTGSVTPLFMVKKSQKLLPDAKWLDAIRPRREWYDGGWRWADDLGEVPEELEIYFSTGDADTMPVTESSVSTGRMKGSVKDKSSQ